ncbi:hypothetical protein [Companilactobacillus nuruki]|uniref:DUF2513 domain-containing protein n=1 Tax=Companilactobacillus nuruki TaxID=1993540 RepID=A0A2N7AUD1_9LACO|nr:hypothetical protein [Companilactobacillus nuruki]PMD70685.1 hypothetical protein CBP76_06425 [Companilactobacillus nuruki]
MNNFDMYKMILEILAEKNPQDFQELLDDSQRYQTVKDYIASDNINQFLIQDMQKMTIQMINDGLISGIISPLKYVTLIKLNGLTILGFQYLKKLRQRNIKSKLEDILKEKSTPITAESLTKVLSELVFQE